MKLINRLRKQAGLHKLLTNPESNPKVKKNGKLGVLTTVLHLAPGDMSGHEVCPKRSPGCSAACLHYAGSPAYMTVKTQARLARTKLLFSNRDLFMNILSLEIDEHLKAAEKAGMDAAVRLNGTSDICWEIKRFNLYPETAEALGVAAGKVNVIDLFPTTTFYDYTAILPRKGAPNYHLTFSLKEHNENDARVALSRGMNVAAVFSGDLPQRWLDVPVIDGDEHDYRPADPVGVVVGLKVKGVRGRADKTGFVNDTSLELALAA